MSITKKELIVMIEKMQKKIDELLAKQNRMKVEIFDLFKSI